MFTEKETLALVDQAIEVALQNFQSKKYEIAELICNQTLKITPENEKVFELLGLIKHQQEKYEEAIEYFQKSLSIKPNNYEALNNIALSFSSIRNFKEAINHLEQAIMLEGSQPHLYSNLGLQYRLINQNDDAIKYLLKANEIKETDVTWTMLGGCYAEIKQYEKAEACFLKALELNPNFDGAHMDLATIYHMTGQMERAWPYYEHRVNVYPQLQIFKKIYEPNKKWNGKIHPKMRLLIHAEQGFGDTIQFSRYLPLFKQHNIYTIFHCDESLAKLLSPLVNELYLTDPVSMPAYEERGSFQVPAYDYHCSLLSLPFLLNNPKIPNPPYLKTYNKFNFDSYKNDYKIGLVWAGNPMHPNDENRSCYLKNFYPLQDIPNVKLFSLMKDIRPRKYKHKMELVDYAQDTNDMEIIDLGPYLNNFMDTAAIIQGLDLVISVDSSVLHLAGALNKKTYALISYDNDWRWQSSGTDSVWYPSITLFRQEQKGNWEKVIADITKAVTKQKNQQS